MVWKAIQKVNGILLVGKMVLGPGWSRPGIIHIDLKLLCHSYH
jgi:hypothetical protein